MPFRKDTPSMNSLKQATQQVRGKQWDRALQAQDTGYDVLPSALTNSDEPQFKRLKLDLIDENAFNARELYDHEKITELAANIKLNGQLVPAIAVKQGERYMLIGGHYRYRALRLTDIETIDAMVYPEGSVNEQDIYLYSFTENNERNEQTVIDNALAWRRVLNEGLYRSATELGEKIGLSQPTITKTLAVLDLPDEVLEIVKSNPTAFGLSVLYELLMYTRAASLEQSIQTAHKLLNKELTRNDLVKQRKALSEKKQGQGRKNQMSRAYPLAYGTVQGTIKEWDSGKVHVEIAFDDEQHKQAFLEHMQSFKL